MIYSCRRMIYLIRKHDIISVLIIREAYFTAKQTSYPSGYIVRDRRERISLKKALAFASAFFLVGLSDFALWAIFLRALLVASSPTAF